MYALSHYTRGTLGLVNLFCRTWSISSLNGVKFYAEGGKWECRHQQPGKSTNHRCCYVRIVLMRRNLLTIISRRARTEPQQQIMLRLRFNLSGHTCLLPDQSWTIRIKFPTGN